MLNGFRPSILATAFVAALVGIGGTVAIVIAAAEAVGATQAQTASWIAGLGIGIAINASLLSFVFKKPITSAWSSPGAAVIAATSGISLPEAVGAFLFCAALLMLTALIRPLRNLVSSIPLPLANALLAGVLFGFVIRIFPALESNPILVLPLFLLFIFVRLWSPLWATVCTLVVGTILAFALQQASGIPDFEITQLTWVWPEFDFTIMLSLGLPLYLVTMAGQNLPGLAVLRAAGYDVDARPILAITGLTSAGVAFIAAHTQNLAAITAALCTSPDAHPDPKKRWMVGPSLGLIYLLIAISAGWLVALFAALPPELLITVAAVGLSGALINALSGSMAEPDLRFPALATFLVAQSSFALLGLGGAFWGLIVGLALWGLSKARLKG